MADPIISAPGSFVPRVALSYGAAEAAAVAVDEAHPLPVAARAVAVSYVDRSGTIASGGTAQVLAPAQATRRGFFVQNLSSGDLWISSVGTAAADQPALRIAPGQLYEAPAHGVPAGAISLFGATSGQSFAAREW
ncbi:MAG: hypothetical protein PGN23_17275 [Sphingomonas adhaesiva]|uniref:hypothetical protein n=1 Tax=Sphingomonas adhaesiva TaxID=28212 RepID=UPI002FFADF72